MSFIVAKKIGMTRIFSDEGMVIPVTLVSIGDGPTPGGQVFKIGDTVKVTGTSKAKGFQGAVKRHGFAGMPASHGHHHVIRHVGSIGQRFPQHTLKGMRMAGRIGGRTVTTRGIRIVSVNPEHGLVGLKGAVPGRRGTVLRMETI